MPLLILVILLPLVLLALMPLILLQRYRMGTARRQARPWLATLHVGLTIFSVLCFFAGLILDTVTRGRREMRRLSYLAQSGSTPA